MKHFKHLLFNTKMKSIQKLWQHNKTRVMGMKKKIKNEEERESEVIKNLYRIGRILIAISSKS